MDARIVKSVGALCLQGGRELTPACEEMDRAVLEHTSGSTVVFAGAARPGSDYAGASARTVAHYRGLGVDVAVVADPRTDASQALDALADGTGLIVMPGGSPGGLLDALMVVDGGSIGRRLVELWRSGTAISGASAGAMVMCARSATPDRSNGDARGLGLVAGMAVPHWSRGSERRWGLDASPLWGLPECGGALVVGDRVTAVGHGEPSIRVDGAWHPLSRSGTDPAPR
jgi:peptidase E